MPNLGDLAGLAAMFYGIRGQRRDVARHNQEKLRQFQDQMKQKQDELDAERKRRDQDAALKRVEFFQKFFASPDDIAWAEEHGTLPSWVSGGEQAFKAAGVPFNFDPFRPKPAAPPPSGTPGRPDLASIVGALQTGQQPQMGAQGQARPVGPPDFATMVADLPGPAGPHTDLFGITPGPDAPAVPPMAGQPVPRFNRLAPDVPGPPTPIAALPPERLAQLFSALGGGSMGPPTPMSAMLPVSEETPQEAVGEAMPPNPFLPAPQEEQPPSRRFRPSYKTQQGEERVDAYGRRVDQQGKEGAARIRNLDARTATEEVLRGPRARAMLSAAGLADARAQETELLLNPRLREAIADAEYAETIRPGLGLAQIDGIRSLVGHRAGTLQETQRHNLATEGLTARGQDMNAEAQRRRLTWQQQRMSATNQVPAGSRPFLARLAALTTATVRTASGSERFLTDEERTAAEAEINAAHTNAFGRPLFGVGGVLSEASVMPSPAGGGKAETGGPMDDRLGGGAGAPAAPGAGHAGGAVDPFVEHVGGMDPQSYFAYHKNAPPDLKKSIERARGEAKRLGLLKGQSAPPKGRSMSPPGASVGARASSGRAVVPAAATTGAQPAGGASQFIASLKGQGWGPEEIAAVLPDFHRMQRGDMPAGSSPASNVAQLIFRLASQGWTPEEIKAVEPTYRAILGGAGSQ